MYAQQHHYHSMWSIVWLHSVAALNHLVGLYVSGWSAICWSLHASCERSGHCERHRQFQGILCKPDWCWLIQWSIVTLSAIRCTM